MLNTKKIASISLALAICSSLVVSYADENNDIVKITKIEESTEEMGEGESTKEEKPEVMKLTLKEAIAEGLKNSPQIEQSKLDLEKAEVDHKENKYDIRVNKKMFSNDKETSLNYLKGIKHPEFANDFALENSKRRHEVIENNLRIEIEEMYFSLLQAEKFTDVSKSNIELSKRLHEISEIKEELGMGIKQETAKSKLNYRKSVEDYEQSLKNLENAKMAFNIKIGLDALQKVELLDKLEQKQLNIEDVESNEEEKNKKKIDIIEKREESIDNYIEKAFKNRNEIKSLEFQYEYEKMGFDIIKKEYSSITFKYKHQEVVLEKAKEALDDAKNNIELQIRSSYKAINQKKSELDSAKQTFDLAKESVRIAEVSYKVGTGVAIDVKNAQNKLNQAELGVSNAILSYNLDILNFEKIIGIGNIAGGM